MTEIEWNEIGAKFSKMLEEFAEEHCLSSVAGAITSRSPNESHAMNCYDGSTFEVLGLITSMKHDLINSIGND